VHVNLSHERDVLVSDATSRRRSGIIAGGRGRTLSCFALQLEPVLARPCASPKDRIRERSDCFRVQEPPLCTLFPDKASLSLSLSVSLSLSLALNNPQPLADLELFHVTFQGARVSVYIYYSAVCRCSASGTGDVCARQLSSVTKST